MKKTRRIKRMSRNRNVLSRINLTSLMDVFTILVFFLLVNSATTEVLETPNGIELPASVVKEKPRETVVIFVSPEAVTVQGEPVILVAEIVKTPGNSVEAIAARLAELDDQVIGVKTHGVSRSQEITILADKTIPFSVIKKVMSTCTRQGYGKISLAVVQKASPANPDVG